MITVWARSTPAAARVSSSGANWGNLVALRTDLDLAHHQGVVVGGGGEQMDLVALGVGSTANRLAVHHDREQLGCLPVGPGNVVTGIDVTGIDVTGNDVTGNDVTPSTENSESRV